MRVGIISTPVSVAFAVVAHSQQASATHAKIAGERECPGIKAAFANFLRKQPTFSYYCRPDQ